MIGGFGPSRPMGTCSSSAGFSSLRLGLPIGCCRGNSPERPQGYDLRIAKMAVAALNIGLLCRVVAEPLERSGHAGTGTLALLTLSAALQIGAAAVFALQIWPRVAARPPRAQSS